MNDMLDHEIVAALADILDEAPAPAARPPLVSALADADRPLGAADDHEAPEVDLGAIAHAGRLPRSRRVLAAAAVVLAVTTGLVVAQARRGAGPDGIGATDGTTVSTAVGPAITKIDGALVRAVVPSLPTGFRAISTGRVMASSARPYVVALDGLGRIITVTFVPFHREEAREPGFPTIVPGPAGTVANASYTSPGGDIVTVTCVIGAQPCDADGAAAEAVVDGRALAAAVATAVAALPADERNGLADGPALTDDADITRADAVLDRISSTLGTSYALVDSGGPVPHRTWRTTSGATRVVTVHALASPLAVEARSASTGDVASAVASGGGWVFVAVARPGDQAGEQGAVLRGQLLDGLSALAARPLVESDAAAGEGRLVLDGPPAGWRVESAFDQRSGGDVYELGTTRLYASESSTPERDPWISLMSTPAEIALEPNGKGVEAVRVNDAAGQLAVVDASGFRLTFGPVAGRWVGLESSGLSRQQFLLLAEAVIGASNGPGLAIPASALPEGMVERAVGTPSESWLVPLSAHDAPIPSAHWTDGRSLLWYTSVRADASLLPTLRLGYGGAGDAIVGGHPAVTTEMGSVRRVAWADGDRLYLVGSSSVDGNGAGLPMAELLALVNRLRPATVKEWSDMEMVASSVAATGAVPTGTAPTTTIVAAG